MPYVPYTELRVWQRAMDLAELSYEITSDFPRTEIWGLTSQIRRAAASVTGNIAEGHGRTTTGEFLNSLSIGRGSLNELDNFVRLGQRLKFATPDRAILVYDMVSDVGRMMVSLQQALRRRQPRRR